MYVSVSVSWWARASHSISVPPISREKIFLFEKGSIWCFYIFSRTVGTLPKSIGDFADLGQDWIPSYRNFACHEAATSLSSLAEAHGILEKSQLHPEILKSHVSYPTWRLTTCKFPFRGFPDSESYNLKLIRFRGAENDNCHGYMFRSIANRNLW